jgi:hypothetical protein
MERALVEPFRQQPATVGIAGVRMGEADIRFDEPGKTEPWAMVVHRRGDEVIAYF